MQLSMLARTSARRAPSLARRSPSTVVPRLACSFSTSSPSRVSSSRPVENRLVNTWHKMLGRKFLPEYDPVDDDPESPEIKTKIILEQDNLFHPLSTSPFEDLRMRADRIKLMAPCPVCLDHFGERNLVTFDSPEAGWPTHCSREHYEQDDQHHLYKDRLREANEDEHDLRSGRELVEFENMPGFQQYDSAINFTDWDTFFYTRLFPSMDNMRVFRHMTKILTYPITVGAVLFDLSPYTRKNARLTKEGERSLAALRQTLQPVQTPEPVPGLNNVVRVFVLGARAESALPSFNWEQLARMYPKANLKIYFIGPQAALPSNWTPDSAVPDYETTADPLYEEHMASEAARMEAEAKANGTRVEPEPSPDQTSSTATASTSGSAPSPSASTSTPPPAANPTPTPDSTPSPSAATASASAAPSSSTAPSTSVASTASSSLVKPVHKSLDRLPMDSPDRQNYPYNMTELGYSEAPISPFIDRSTLAPKEGAYGATFYRPPTPTLTQVDGSYLQKKVKGRDESANYGVPAWTTPVSEQLTMTNIQAPYEQIHEQFGPFDPYSDVFFAFSPGFGFPSSMTPGALQVQRDAEWGETLPLVLQTKCPLFVTGFSPADVERDVKSLEGLEDVDGKYDWLLNPGENFFSSERWEVAEFDPRVLVKTNWGIWGIRGKMNEIQPVDKQDWGLVDKMTRRK